MILNYTQYQNLIYEKLITFDGKVYPKYNNVVVMCGGGGSGKGFVVSNVLGIDAKVLNVDDIKETLLKFKDDNPLSVKYKNKYGKYLSQVDLRNGEECSNLHEFVEANALAKKYYNKLFRSEYHKKDKTNLLFDVTLKNYPKLEDISGLCLIGGYKPENVHLVWVLNNYDTASKQNKMRDRKVPENILKKTHVGCADTVRKLLDKTDSLGIVNGDVWIYFGSTFTGDAKMVNSPNGGKYLEDFCVVKVKDAGKELESYDEIMNKKVKIYDSDYKEIGETTLKDKINSYIPIESSRF
jgi:predicted kinase